MKMKKILSILSLCMTIALGAAGQQYNPTLFNTSSKSIGMYGNNPVDARSYYYDPSTYVRRPYADTQEVLSYLGTSARGGNFLIFVTDSIGNVDVWWFRNGTADSNLVRFNPQPITAGSLDTTSLSYRINSKADTSSTTALKDSLTNIRNDIPAAQVNSDWNATSGLPQILHKPIIPTDLSQLTNSPGYLKGQDTIQLALEIASKMPLSDSSKFALAGTTGAVQSDWNQTNPDSLSYIRNKPTIPTAVSQLSNDLGFTTINDNTGTTTSTYSGAKITTLVNGAVTLNPGIGINYDPTTHGISAKISGTTNNALTTDGGGGLYVPISALSGSDTLVRGASYNPKLDDTLRLTTNNLDTIKARMHLSDAIDSGVFLPAQNQLRLYRYNKDSIVMTILGGAVTSVNGTTGNVQLSLSIAGRDVSLTNGGTVTIPHDSLTLSGSVIGINSSNTVDISGEVNSVVSDTAAAISSRLNTKLRTTDTTAHWQPVGNYKMNYDSTTATGYASNSGLNDSLNKINGINGWLYNPATKTGQVDSTKYSTVVATHDSIVANIPNLSIYTKYSDTSSMLAPYTKRGSNISQFSNDVGYYKPSDTTSTLGTKYYINSQGFLKSYTETDPVWNAAQRGNTMITGNWSFNTAGSIGGIMINSLMPVMFSNRTGVSLLGYNFNITSADSVHQTIPSQYSSALALDTAGNAYLYIANPYSLVATPNSFFTKYKLATQNWVNNNLNDSLTANSLDVLFPLALDATNKTLFADTTMKDSSLVNYRQMKQWVNNNLNDSLAANSVDVLFPLTLDSTNKTLSADTTMKDSSLVNYRQMKQYVGTNAPTSGGTVTSVGLSLPNTFTISGSPVTSSGTLAAVYASQSANTFLAAPGGSNGTPSFRTIVPSDIPTLNQNTTGNAATATTATNSTELNGQAASYYLSTSQASSTYTPIAGFNTLTSDSTILISGTPKVYGTGNIRINPNLIIGNQPVDSIGLTDSLKNLGDVALSSPVSGQVLGYNGTNWTNVASGSTPSLQSVMGVGNTSNLTLILNGANTMLNINGLTTGISVPDEEIQRTGTSNYTIGFAPSIRLFNPTESMGAQWQEAFGANQFFTYTPTQQWVERLRTDTTGKVSVLNGYLYSNMIATGATAIPKYNIDNIGTLHSTTGVAGDSSFLMIGKYANGSPMAMMGVGVTNQGGITEVLADSSGIYLSTAAGGKVAFNSNGSVQIPFYTNTDSLASMTTDANGNIILREGVYKAIKIVTATTYSILSGDYTIIFTGTANTTFTLPDPTTCKGRIYRIENRANSGISIGVNYNLYETTTTTINSINSAAGYEIQSDGSNWWIIDTDTI